MQQIDLSAALPLVRETPSFEGVRLAMSDGRPLTLGVGDAAKAATIAALASEWPGPVLVITARADRAEALAEETAAWLGDPGASSCTPNATPYRTSGWHPHLTSCGTVCGRLRSSATESARVIFAPALWPSRSARCRPTRRDRAFDGCARASASKSSRSSGN